MFDWLRTPIFPMVRSWRGETCSGDKNLAPARRPRVARVRHIVLLDALEPRLLLSALPYGHVDVLNNTQVAGWAYSPDAGANPVEVELNVDGTNSFYQANQNRPDLQTALGSPDHGFSITLPTLAPGAHNITVSIVNPDTAAVVYLDSAVLTNAVPIGHVDSVSSTGVTGWAFDANAGSNPIEVRVDVNGVQGTPFLANQTRSDLQTSLGSSDHGFTLTGNYAGQAVDVYAIDAPTGDPVLIYSNAVAPTGHVDVFSANQISGWAYDANLGASATQVRINIDGNTGTPFTADLARPDLQNTLGSANHGFTFNATSLTPGSHTIQVYALNSDSTSATATLIGGGTIVNSAPFGHIDVVNNNTISGWAYDPDAAGNPISVNIQVDGATVGSVLASGYRPDLTNFLGSPYHGFTFNFSGLSSAPHTVTVQAIDVPSGVPTTVASTLINDVPPFGNLDFANTANIYGWAYDRSFPTTPVTVQLKVDGTTYGSQQANLSRPDLNSITNGNNNHGFAFSTPDLGPGVHTVQVYMLDPSSGAQVLLNTLVYNNAGPFGHVDASNSTTISGWAYDPNAGSSPVQVQIDVNGNIYTTVNANNSRPDLQNFLGSSNHGFSVTGNFANSVVDVYMLDNPSNIPILLYSNNLPAYGHVDSLTLTNVSGWAYAPNAGSSPADVRVDVGGFTGIPQAATNPRPDLTAVVGSPNHGFSIPLGVGSSPLGPGAHTVNVYAFNPNAALSSANLTLLESATINNPAPFGHVDSVTNNQVVGWAYDPNAGAAPVVVDVRVDGTPVAITQANVNRPDLQSGLGSSAHGFVVNLPQNLVGPHTVTVYAYDNPSNVIVPIGTVQINNPAPVGVLESATPGAISGWAYDATAGTGPVTVQLMIDGAQRVNVVANGNRPDLQAVLGSPDHGFSVTTPTVGFGTHSVIAYAINPFDNSLTEIGSTTFTVATPIGHVDTITASSISGWAFDTNSGNSPIDVQVNVDGVSGTPFLASLNRPDLVPSLGSADHGFSMTLNLSPGQHTVDVYAIGPTNGEYVFLGGGTVSA